MYLSTINSRNVTKLTNTDRLVGLTLLSYSNENYFTAKLKIIHSHFIITSQTHWRFKNYGVRHDERAKRNTYACRITLDLIFTLIVLETVFI